MKNGKSIYIDSEIVDAYEKVFDPFDNDTAEYFYATTNIADDMDNEHITAKLNLAICDEIKCCQELPEIIKKAQDQGLVPSC